MKLNCDLGESFGNWTMGLDEQVMPYIDQANIACGFHAGDPLVMQKTLALAKEHKVSVGAHPGYPDLVGFGRRSINCSTDEIIALIHYQIAAIDGVAKSLDIELEYVKPHGALYNQAAKDREISRSIGEAVLKFNPNLIMIGLFGSVMLHVWQEMGLQVMEEAFGDRTYESDGSLRNRNLDHALITNPKKAAQQAQMIINYLNI